MMRTSKCALWVTVIGCLAGTASAETKLLSPDSALELRVFNDAGRLKFTVRFKKTTVVEPSAIVFSVDGVDLTENAEPGVGKTYEINETYPWRGVHSKAVNRCNGTLIPLAQSKSKYLLTLELRAFNDGAAFRILCLGDSDTRVPDEATQFVLPAGSTVWYHDLEGHYEAVHRRKAVEDASAGEWAAPPLTFQLPKAAGFGCITEAGLFNYAGMALQAAGDRRFQLVLGHKHHVSYPFRLRYKEDIERLSKPAAVSGTIATPWRVVMVAADLNGLVNSDVIHNLANPADAKLFPKGMETDWLKPGRTVWKYMDGGSSTFEGTKEFCRLAGELGFEYNVIEGYWKKFSDEQLKELVNYGRERGVGLFLWLHSKNIRDGDARRALFKKCQDLGIAGLKIDFFDHDAKEVMDYYHTLLRETAECRLLVNFHGSTKPMGESRTWPNEMVRESVRGMESSKLKDRAKHDATLPFTRFIVGHGDYTPVHFGERRADTTWAHQVATAAVFTAPLLLYAAHPKSILENPAAPMMKSIPSTWDETIALACSEIGEVAAFAKRKGDTWFLAIINGTNARNVRIPLSFLPAGEHQALVVRDHKTNSAALETETISARAGDTLAIDLANGGGYIARFSKKQ